MHRNQYILRCYARPEGDHLIAACIDLDITVRGNTISQVKRELNSAIKSYLDSIDKENIVDVFPRPSPLNIKAEYYAIFCLVNCAKFIKNIRNNFLTFCELATPQDFKLTPCA